MRPKKLFEDTPSTDDGLCWVDGKLCKNRQNFKGCQDCDVKIEYYRKHPVFEEVGRKRKRKGRQEEDED